MWKGFDISQELYFDADVTLVIDSDSHDPLICLGKEHEVEMMGSGLGHTSSDNGKTRGNEL